MRIVSFLNIIRTLYLVLFVSDFALSNSASPRVSVESQHPLALTVFDRNVLYKLTVPRDFMLDIEGMYDDVYVEDLTGDGVGEVVFRLLGNGANSCSKVLRYNGSDQSFSELIFGHGALCNFRMEDGYIVSSYVDGAALVEDFYIIEGDKVSIKLSDRCIGCGAVSRTYYRSDGSFTKALVSDGVRFDKRLAIVAKVTSSRAEIFYSSAPNSATGKYLVQGDKVVLLGIENIDGVDWVEFKTLLGEGSGWLMCRDLDFCG